MCLIFHVKTHAPLIRFIIEILRARMEEDKIDRIIIDFFAALKELGELRQRYDDVIGNVRHHYIG